MAKKNKAHVFDFTGILNAEINQQDWKAKKKLLEDQFGKFKMALDTDLAEAEAQKVLDMFNEKLNLQLNVDQVRKDAEAVKKIIETALASINNIDTSALKGIEDTLNGIATTTEKIFDKIGSNAQNAFNNIEQGAKKASKGAIKSVGQVEAALKRVGKGTDAFKDIQNTVRGKFEIKNKPYTKQEAQQVIGDIAQQRKAVRENPNATWEQKYAADIKFVDAYKGYRVKFGQLSDEAESLYKSLLETYYDQKNMLQNIVNMGKSTKKNPKPLVGYDGGEPWARESTLKEVRDILKGGIKVSDNDNIPGNNQPSKQQGVVDIEKELKGIVSQFENDYNQLLADWGDKKINDDEFDLKQKELINKTSSNLKVNAGFDIQQAMIDAMTDGASSSELLKILKDNVVGIEIPVKPAVESKATTPNQQSTDTTVGIDETALGNAIANALKGVQLNTNTQGEVKASIDATELKGVLHDGTPYDVKVVQDDGSNEATDSATQDRISEELKQVERVIRNCKDWIEYLDDVLDDNNFTASGKGDAADKLRNRTKHLVDVRQHPKQYEAFEYSAEKAEIAWMKAYKEAEKWGVARSTLAQNSTDADASYNSNVEKLSKEKAYWQDKLTQKESELQLLKQQLQNTNSIKTTPGSSDVNASKVIIDEAALESVLNRVFPKSDGSEPWAKDTTLGEVKGVLESIKTNTDKFVADNTDPRAETLKNEIQALKTKHPNDLFEAADNQKLITDKENELNNLGGKSVNYTQIATALVQIASVLTAKTIEAAIGANTNAVETFTQHLSGQTSYFESLQQILGGIADAFKQSNISTTIITTGNVLEALNNTLNGVSRLVAVPTGSDVTPQQISVDSVSVNEKANGLSKRKILTDANGKPKRQADTVVERTSNTVKTKTQLFEYDKAGNPIPSDILTVEDFDKFIKEQKSERQKIDAAKAKLKEFLTQFNNKTLGKAEQISGYNELGELLNTDWKLDTIDEAKQKMLALNAEFNKLSQNFRKGSSSLNPFVNAINNTEKLESQIQNIQLDFAALKNAPEELYTTVSGLQGDFEKVMSLKDGNDIEAYSLAYGNLREKIVKVVNEIRILRKEQGIAQKSALFDENKEVISVRSDAQVQEWERMSYIPDELRDKFRLLHSELNNVVDQDELNIWKKQWEQIRVQITALRREHQGMESDLKEVLTIYEEIGRNEAKIEGLQSEGEKDVYRKRNLALEEEAKELAKIYGLNVDLAAIEKARADAKKSGMVRVDAAQERKTLNERIKAERKAARINASNTKWNAGQNALLDLWKIDDDSINVGALPAVKQLEKALKDLTSAQKRADDAIRNNTQDVPAATKNLENHSRVVASLTTNVKELISNYERFSGANATEIGGFAGGDWEQQVTAAIEAQYPGARIKSINHDLQEVTYELKTGARAFTEYTAGVRQADRKIMALKGTTRKLPTFLEGVKKKLGEISQYFSAMSLISRAMQELRKGLQYIKEIDLALTELKKVTDETEQTYDKFLDTASKTAAKVGSTIRDVVSSTADWARLGYAMKDAAKFAESTQILMNVSEFTDVSQATDTLISAVQAFGYTAETSMDVVDLLNMIGNNYAVSTADLAQSLTKSSASLVAAGGNLAEAAALTATANAIVQDADSVGK